MLLSFTLHTPMTVLSSATVTATAVFRREDADSWLSVGLMSMGADCAVPGLRGEAAAELLRQVVHESPHARGALVPHRVNRMDVRRRRLPVFQHLAQAAAAQVARDVPL